MKNHLVLLPIMCAFLAGPALGEQRVEVIELQDLVWELYEPSRGWYSGSATFSLPQIPTSIDSVSIRAAGTMENGITCCPEVADWGLEIIAFLGKSEVNDPWWGFMHFGGWRPIYSGPFDKTFGFVCLGGCASFEQIFSGSGEVTFDGFPSGGSTFGGIQPPTGTLETVYLEIIGDFPVPNTVNSWGEVKCLFR